MARVIDAEQLCNIFADRYTHQSFSFVVKDELLEENNGAITLSDGMPTQTVTSYNLFFTSTSKNWRLSYWVIAHRNWRNHCAPSFPEKQPGMHFMLE